MIATLGRSAGTVFGRGGLTLQSRARAPVAVGNQQKHQSPPL